jgi:hypothetical protein
MTMPLGDRRALRFAEVVREEFAFLQSHGFKCVRSDATLVRFKSQHVRLGVYHGRRSFEIGLDIRSSSGSLGEPNYSMAAVIRMVDPSKADQYRDFAARSAEEVVEGVRRLSALLRAYAEAGILDDPGLFERLRKDRESWVRDYAQKVNLTQKRRELEEAWRAKDYVRVVTLLRPLRDALTPSELKKLEYAEKHTA